MTSCLPRLLVALALGSAAACGATSTPPTVSDASTTDPVQKVDGSAGSDQHAQRDGSAGPEQPASADGSVAACPTGKIAFTQAAGCHNDNGVEFCIPAHDEALRARLRAIRANLAFVSSGGRAGCDTNEQQLVMVHLEPAPSADCDPDGAMTDETWSDVCRMAAEPAVTQVVHTFFE